MSNSGFATAFYNQGLMAILVGSAAIRSKRKHQPFEGSLYLSIGIVFLLFGLGSFILTG